MDKRTIILILIIISICGGVLGVKYFKFEDSKKPKFQVYKIPKFDKVYSNGIIKSDMSKDLYLDSSKGEIVKIYVENKQIVNKGDLLYLYYNRDITSQIEGLNREIKSLQNEKNNSKNLSLNEDIYSIDNQINSIQKQISSLKGKEYSSIRAPFSGKIYLSNQIKDKVMTIKSQHFYVQALVTEVDYFKLKENQLVDINIYANDKSMKAKITDISDIPVAQDENLNITTLKPNVSYYEFDIVLESQEDIVEGLHVQATIKLDDESILIPKKSILRSNNETYVFAVKNNVVKKVKVEIGKEHNDDIVIIKGLSGGDSIIANPNTSIKEDELID